VYADNGEATFYGFASSNHLNQGQPYFDALSAFVPQGRAMARLLYGCPGVQVPGGIGPNGMVVGIEADMGQRWQVLMATVPFVEYWRYTRDQSWAKRVGYPFVSEVLEFWECWLVRNGTTGTWDDINDNISELGFFSEDRDAADSVDSNPIQTLAFLRFIIRGALDLSTTLNIREPERRELWQEIAAGLRNYTIEALPLPEPDGPAALVYSCGRSGPEYYRTVHAIVPGSNPEMIDEQIGRNTLQWMNEWFQGNEFPFVYTAAARVKYNTTSLIFHLESNLMGLVNSSGASHRGVNPMFPPCDGAQERAGGMTTTGCVGLQNNLYMRDGGGGIETIGATQSVNDLLMQSWRDYIELFPHVPAGSEASFSLRAVGGFLVSASRSANGVVDEPVIVTSTVGGNCTLLSPWVHLNLVVRAVSSGAVVAVWAAGGGLMRFDTSNGETYHLVRGGTSGGQAQD
jgi:hypothetical protein